MKLDKNFEICLDHEQNQAKDSILNQRFSLSYIYRLRVPVIDKQLVSITMMKHTKY